MEWYEIIGAVAVFFVGIMVYRNLREFMKNRHFNDSWKNRRK